MQDFRVKGETFEGPLDLLLSLIESRKLHISEISLSKIVDDYIDHIQVYKKDERELSQFLGVLSTLLLIKSRALLPGTSLTKEETEEISELEHNLERYSSLKRAALGLTKLHRKKGYLHVEGIELSKVAPVFKPFASLTLESLRDAAEAIRIRVPKLPETYEKVGIKAKVRLEEILNTLLDRINSSFSLSFSSVTEKATRYERVLHFLALLELVKMGVVKADQEQEDIVIERFGVDIPRYGSIY